MNSDAFIYTGEITFKMKKAWSFINCGVCKEPVSTQFLQLSRFPCWLLAGALLAVMPMLAGASSISLPPATYSGMGVADVDDSFTQTYNVTGPGTYSASASAYGASASSTMTISTQPFPSVSVISTATTGPNASGGAQGNPYGNTAAPYQIRYFIEFLGPQGTVPIQINATVAASVSNSNPFADAESYFNVFLGTPSYPEIGDSVTIQPLGVTDQEIAGVSQLITANPNTGAYSGGGIDSQIWLAQTNTVYTVALSALAYTLGNTQVAASVDPTFQIASSVTDPADYSISISDGIGDSAETTSIAPEPTSATLALCGAFATVCGVFRRRMKAHSRSC